MNTTSGELSGYAWGENIGWLNVRGTADDATDFGVTALLENIVPVCDDLPNLNDPEVEGDVELAVTVLKVEVPDFVAVDVETGQRTGADQRRR